MSLIEGDSHKSPTEKGPWLLWLRLVSVVGAVNFSASCMIMLLADTAVHDPAVVHRENHLGETLPPEEFKPMEWTQLLQENGITVWQNQQSEPRITPGVPLFVNEALSITELPALFNASGKSEGPEIIEFGEEVIRQTEFPIEQNRPRAGLTALTVTQLDGLPAVLRGVNGSNFQEPGIVVNGLNEQGELFLRAHNILRTHPQAREWLDSDTENVVTNGIYFGQVTGPQGEVSIQFVLTRNTENSQVQVLLVYGTFHEGHITINSVANIEQEVNSTQSAQVRVSKIGNLIVISESPGARVPDVYQPLYEGYTFYTWPRPMRLLDNHVIPRQHLRVYGADGQELTDIPLELISHFTSEDSGQFNRPLVFARNPQGELVLKDFTRTGEIPIWTEDPATLETFNLYLKMGIPEPTSMRHTAVTFETEELNNHSYGISVLAQGMAEDNVWQVFKRQALETTGDSSFPFISTFKGLVITVTNPETGEMTMTEITAEMLGWDKTRGATPEVIVSHPQQMDDGTLTFAISLRGTRSGDLDVSHFTTFDDQQAMAFNPITGEINGSGIFSDKPHNQTLLVNVGHYGWSAYAPPRDPAHAA